MNATLENYINQLDDGNLIDTCRTLLEHDKFSQWPAALKWHHAYGGGLLEHTLEVTELALKASPESGVDKDVLIAACLWHDVAKCREYDLLPAYGNPDALDFGYVEGVRHQWVRSDFYAKIGHVVGSTGAFYHAAMRHNVEGPLIDQIAHCILSHHGRREWGSPVEPQTVEALLLHQADMLSAKYGATK